MCDPGIMAAGPKDHDNGRLQVFLKHRKALVDHATPIIGRSDAEDVVQEAYFRFALNDPEARLPHPGAAPVEQPAAYLFRIVRNLAIDWLRRVAADTRRIAVQETMGQGTEMLPSPEEELLHRDELRRVQMAMAELPPKTRRVFALHRLEHQTFQQIAAAEKISVTTAHRLAQEALLHLMRHRQRMLQGVGTRHGDATTHKHLLRKK